jgi:hypothetical protein
MKETKTLKARLYKPLASILEELDLDILDDDSNEYSIRVIAGKRRGFLRRPVSLIMILIEDKVSIYGQDDPDCASRIHLIANWLESVLAVDTPISITFSAEPVRLRFMSAW